MVWVMALSLSWLEFYGEKLEWGLMCKRLIEECASDTGTHG